jgi:hypothetical protein
LSNHPPSSGHSIPSPTQARKVLEHSHPLVHVKGSRVFLNDSRHAHLQGCAEIRFSHQLEASRSPKHSDKLFRQAIDVVCGEELHGDLFLPGQFNEILNIGRQNWETVLAGEVGYAT